MLEIFIGIISGAFSGIGMGGGTILILMLSNFMGINQHIAQATNLIFFVPTAITAIITIIKDKLINFKLGITVAISGIIGAIIGSQISIRMEIKYLKKSFGIFLFLITIYEIYSLIKMYKSKKNINNKYVNKFK